MRSTKHVFVWEMRFNRTKKGDKSSEVCLASSKSLNSGYFFKKKKKKKEKEKKKQKNSSSYLLPSLHVTCVVASISEVGISVAGIVSSHTKYCRIAYGITR